MLRESMISNTYLKGVEFSSLNRNGNRSAARTDILHKGVVDFVFEQLELNDAEWSVNHEQKVPCTRSTESQKGKTFSVDVTLTHVESNVNVRILFKSIEKSYNKNRENFANTTIGETQRLHGMSDAFGSSLKEERADDVTVFFTILPQHVLMGKGSEVTRYTKPHIEDLRNIHSHTHQVCAMLENSAEFSNLEEFYGSFTGKVLNSEEFYGTILQIGENIDENIRLIRLRKNNI